MAFNELDFLNQNSLRNYPIKEGVSRVDTLGVFTIPTNFLVDIEIAASWDPSKRYFISRITNLEDTIGIEVSDETATLVGSFLITTATHTQYKTYSLTATPAFVGASGAATVGVLTAMQSLATGSYNFTLTTAELEMRTCIPALRGITRLKFLNANGESFALTGDVEIVARQNLAFRLGPGNSVIVDAGNGLGLNTKCAEELGCIKTINGIPGDSEGDFTLDFSDCALLTPIPANTGLLLEDICCKPCMGCNDIEELTNRLMTAETSLIQLRDYYVSLTTLYEQFKVTATYTCDNCPPGS